MAKCPFFFHSRPWKTWTFNPGKKSGTTLPGTNTAWGSNSRTALTLSKWSSSLAAESPRLRISSCSGRRMEYE
jgi:hypothetical protein